MNDQSEFAERANETLADTTQNNPRIGASATIVMHEITLSWLQKL